MYFTFIPLMLNTVNTRKLAVLGCYILLAALNAASTNAARIPRDASDPGLHASSNQEGTINRTKAEEYLRRYGYLSPERNSNEENGPLTHVDALLYEAVRRFQAMVGLNVSGILDLPTVIEMNKPRCGVPDYITEGKYAYRPASYNLVGSKWDKTELLYMISRYTTDLPIDLVNDVMARALQEWSRVIPLTFHRVTYEPTNVNIQFVQRDHSDNYPFDGPGGQLAHAFYPTDGRVHLDDDEAWTMSADSADGINLYQIILHEFGHTLGLNHSNVKGSVMHPSYDPTVQKWSLHPDDVAAVQELYGAVCSVSTQYMCSSGRKCIQRAWICDGDDDCGDTSDETNCPSSTTIPTTTRRTTIPTTTTTTAISIMCSQPGTFVCNNRRICVWAHWVCDGDNDCGDYSDELNCPGRPTTMSSTTKRANTQAVECPDRLGYRFMCTNGQKCINVAFVCDKDDDCDDWSDEQHCTGLYGLLKKYLVQ